MGYSPLGHKELDVTENEGGQKKPASIITWVNSLHQIYIFVLLLVLLLWITLTNMPASVPNHISQNVFLL